MENYSLSIGGAIGTGWEYAKKHGLMVAVIMLALGVISLLINKITGVDLDEYKAKVLTDALSRGDMKALTIFAEHWKNNMGSAFVSNVLSILIYTGFYNLALGLMSGRFTSIGMNVFSMPLTVYVKFFVLEILVSIIEGVSIMLCVIPAFFIIPRIVFAPIYLIDHPDAGIIEALTASWNMTKGNTLSIIGLGLVFIGLYIIGILCCCVGVFFAEAIMLFAFTAAYYQLRGNLQ
ncbi:MAG: hypothetical protein J1F40_08515 [Prevotellaceae bacterium]|nr:hypothetical protein [Prevotellaceae bacterium]